jgi:hypothetical protein
MKMNVFWDAAPRSLVEVSEVLTVSILGAINTIVALMMEAISTSETSENFYQTRRRNIPENSHLPANSSSSPYFDCTSLTVVPVQPAHVF